MKRRVTLIVALASAVFGIVAGVAWAQPAASASEKFVLTGLVYVEGGRGFAWLQEPTFTSNQVIVVRVGDAVGPYRLTKILDDQVELEGPGGRVSVPLAGTGGAVSVAAIPADVATVPDSHPTNGNQEPIVLQRGDPRRSFPMSDLMIGAGAIVEQAPVPLPSRGPRAMNQEQRTVPSAMRSTAGSSTTPASSGPIIIPPGDPRRSFPAASLLIGAGAQVGN